MNNKTNNQTNLTVKDFFFCYNINIMKYLQERNIDYIVEAQHKRTKKVYYMFHRNERLNDALNNYHIIRKNTREVL